MLRACTSALLGLAGTKHAHVQVQGNDDGTAQYRAVPHNITFWLVIFWLTRQNWHIFTGPRWLFVKQIKMLTMYKNVSVSIYLWGHAANI